VLGGLGRLFGFALAFGPRDRVALDARPEDQSGSYQRHQRERRVDPVRSRDADLVPDAAEERRQPAAQIHQGVKHGVGHAGRLGVGELAHAGVSGRLVHAVTGDDDQDSDHRHDV